MEQIYRDDEIVLLNLSYEEIVNSRKDVEARVRLREDIRDAISHELMHIFLQKRIQEQFYNQAQDADIWVLLDGTRLILKRKNRYTPELYRQLFTATGD
jgi:hypothetical protein